MRDGLRSQLDDLEAELAEYDALRQGVVTLEADSIVGIGEALVKARIARVHREGRTLHILTPQRERPYYGQAGNHPPHR